jgi:hypothetical protein
MDFQTVLVRMLYRIWPLLVSFYSAAKKKFKAYTHTHNFSIFELSEDTGRLSGLRGSDNESEEE